MKKRTITKTDLNGIISIEHVETASDKETFLEALLNSNLQVDVCRIKPNLEVFIHMHGEEEKWELFTDLINRANLGYVGIRKVWIFSQVTLLGLYVSLYNSSDIIACDSQGRLLEYATDPGDMVITAIEYANKFPARSMLNTDKLVFNG